MIHPESPNKHTPLDCQQVLCIVSTHISNAATFPHAVQFADVKLFATSGMGKDWFGFEENAIVGVLCVDECVD